MGRERQAGAGSLDSGAAGSRPEGSRDPAVPGTAAPGGRDSKSYRSASGSASQQNVAVLTGGALGSAIFYCPAATLYT